MADGRYCRQQHRSLFSFAMTKKINYLEVCAAVVFDNQCLLLATRKPRGSLAGKWEFPGGKVANQESLQNCIVRELNEELGLKINAAQELFNVTHLYPDKAVRLHFMLCETNDAKGIKPLEGQKIGWFKQDDWTNLDMAPADRETCKKIAGNDNLVSIPNLNVVNLEKTNQLRLWFQKLENPPKLETHTIK